MAYDLDGVSIGDNLAGRRPTVAEDAAAGSCSGSMGRRPPRPPAKPLPRLTVRLRLIRSLSTLSVSV